MIRRGLPLILVDGAVRRSGVRATKLTVDHAWARATPGAATIGAVYFVIANPTGSGRPRESPSRRRSPKGRKSMSISWMAT